jgi:hypothetical protein
MGGEGGCHAALRYQVQSSDVVEMGAEDVCKLFRAGLWPLKRARESSLLSFTVVWRVCAD